MCGASLWPAKMFLKSKAFCFFGFFWTLDDFGRFGEPVLGVCKNEPCGGPGGECRTEAFSMQETLDVINCDSQFSPQVSLALHGSAWRVEAISILAWCCATSATQTLTLPELSIFLSDLSVISRSGAKRQLPSIEKAALKRLNEFSA